MPISGKSKLLAVLAAAAALAALAAVPALADPPPGTVPRPADVVGVGAGSTEYLFDQLSADYSGQNTGAAPQLYSWDATNPATGASGGQIVTKAGCAAIARPDGSSAGITALAADVTDPDNAADYCVDFARSSRPRQSTDPACTTGGVCFLALAGDAVTYAVRDAASGGSNAPANLTTADLTKIYTCTVTNWDQAGGKNAPIHAFLPETASGTRASFLAAIGVTTPGACVSDGATGSSPGGTIQEDEGINPVLDDPDAIIPFSAASYVAQAYHSAACAKSACTGSPACTPSGSQNTFGCDETGVLGLGEINGTQPLTSASPPAINPNFTAAFQTTDYDVVRYDPATADHIPAYLEPFFAATTAKTPGWICASPTAAADIADYGFLPATSCQPKLVKTTFTCHGTGTATLYPGIPASGTPVRQSVTIRGKETGCTSTSGASIAPASGLFSYSAGTGPVSCATLAATGMTAKGSYSDFWNTGATNDAAKLAVTFPAATGPPYTGTYAGKITGTLGSGKESGSVTLDPSTSGACASSALTQATVTTTNTFREIGYIIIHSTTNTSTTVTGHTDTATVTGRYLWGNDVTSVSCVSSTFCAAVDYVGDALTYNGTTWTSDKVELGPDPLNSVSCPTADFCEAVDIDGNAWTWNSTNNGLTGTWSPSPTNPNPIDSANDLTSVSCPTANFCMAVDNRISGIDQGFAFEYLNGNWLAGKPVDILGLNAVSCSSADYCAAVDGSGNAYIWTSTNNGLTGTWSAGDDIDGSHDLTSVSCPPDGFCMAVDSLGNAFTTKSSITTWSSLPAGTYSQDPNGFASVSCLQSGYCEAVGQNTNPSDGDAASTRHSGHQWFSYDPDSNAMTAVSCAVSDGFCMGVDSAGNFLTNGPTTNWSVPVNFDPNNGTVTFSVAGPCSVNSDYSLTCPTATQVGSPATLYMAPEGTATSTSASFTPSRAGWYCWSATYSGGATANGSSETEPNSTSSSECTYYS